jgi:hypothetical protein
VAAQDRAIAAENAIAAWQRVLATVHTNTVPGEDGMGEEVPATPESVRDHMTYLQSEWDAAERRAGELERERSLLADFVNRRFPIQDGPSVPWGVMLPHDRQCQSNHGGQTLQRLAERGGLGASEAWCVVNAIAWWDGEKRWGHDEMKRLWHAFAEKANLAVLRSWSQTAADALAAACAVEVRAGRIPDRSPVADALRDYQDERSPGPAVPR